jgi:hypothetical protein
MFNQLKSRILGPKAGNNRGNSKSANPYADIPIFDDVGSIGMPGFDSTSRDESKHADSPESKDAFSPLRERKLHDNSERKSTGKRSRKQLSEDIEGILQDKENVPKIPKVSHNNSNIIQVEKPFENDMMKKVKKSVTIEETATVFSDQENDDHNGNDSRFTTDRREGDKAKHRSGRYTSSAAESKDNDDDSLDTSYQQYDEYDHGNPFDENDSYEYEERCRMREYLFSKVRHNHYDVVEAAIKGGQHEFKGKFAYDDKGNTLVHVAIQNNLKKMTSLLMTKAKCPINIENKKCMTPLDYAEMYKFHNLTEWLLSKGAVNGSAPRK